MQRTRKRPDPTIQARRLSLGAAAVIGVTGMILFPQDSAGWISLYLTVLAVNLDKELRVRPAYLLCALAVLAAHHGVAVTNAYWFTVTGADADARTFDIYARNRDYTDLSVAMSVDLYRNFLIVLYQSAGNSLFLGEQASVFAFTAAFLIFNRLLKIAGVERFRIAALLAFGLAPHVLIYTSLTLREAWQLLFFVSTVYYGIRCHRGFNPVSLALFALSSVCLALLHQVLVPLAVVVVTILVIWAILRRKSYIRAAMAVGAIVVMGIVSYAAIQFMADRGVVGVGILTRLYEIDAMKFLQLIADYRDIINDDQPRTGFEHGVNTSSIPMFLYTLPRLYVQYLFTPYPWNIETLSDVVLGGVSLGRLFLVSIGVIGLWTLRRSRYFYLFTLLYFVACSTWILGTTNYGQASRHHVVSDWLLLIMGAMVLEKIFRRLSAPRH